MSVPFEKRGRRMDECLELHDQCWTREYVDFESEFYARDSPSNEASSHAERTKA